MVFVIFGNSAMIKIVIVEDHELFLKGLEQLLAHETDIQILSCITSGNGLLTFLKGNPEPDLLLLDVNLPDFDAENLLGQLREKYPDLPIIYLTIQRGLRLFHKLKKHEIQGYLLKDTPYETLIQAIRTVANGGVYFTKDISLDFLKDQSIAELGFVNKSVDVILTARELEVLTRICQELSSAEIAELLFISPSTVDTHRQNLMVKMGAKSVVGLVKYAYGFNLVKP